MKVVHTTIRRKTRGSGDFLDITEDVTDALRQTGMQSGLLTVFVVGSTAAITTCEFEPGLVQDLEEFFERLAPRTRAYHHDQTWQDANGFSHVRASFQGPSLSVPFERGKLRLGTWQQVVLAEFDTRARDRTVVVTCMGE